jgi:protein SCO1/2
LTWRDSLEHTLILFGDVAPTMNCRHLAVTLACASIVAMLAAGLGAQSRPAAISSQTIPDVELVDQHNRKVHFYSDLVKGKVVAISTIFTTCTTICPVIGAKFSSLSRMLAAEERGKVTLISISVDPEVDTPELLDEWSRRSGTPGPDWILLTGTKADVDKLLKALQLFTPDKQEHAPGVLIGADGAGDWARPSASYSALQLATLIRARLEPPAGHAMAGR